MEKELSNAELDQKLVTSSKHESKVLVQVLKHLAEIDMRGYYRELGFSSLFEYCVKRLKYSESSAAKRIAVARASRKFPILDLLESQQVTLSSLSEIVGVLTESNYPKIIDSVKGKSTREVRAATALLKPESKVRELIKPIAVKVDSKGEAFTTPLKLNSDVPLIATNNDSNTLADFTPDAAVNLQENKTSLETPELEQQFLIKFAADKEFMDKINKLKILKGNKSLLELFKIVLDEYINRHAPQMRAQRREKREQVKKAKENNNPIKEIKVAEPARPSRHIPEATRDEIFIRDGARCTYKSPDGQRCSETRGLEIDHIYPFALGGTSEPANLRLACKAHNLLFAEQVFGKEKIGGYLKTST